MTTAPRLHWTVCRKIRLQYADPQHRHTMAALALEHETTVRQVRNVIKRLHQYNTDTPDDTPHPRLPWYKKS